MDGSSNTGPRKDAFTPHRSWGFQKRWVGVAIGSVMLGAALHLLPDRLFGGSQAFITFYPIVAVAALLAGRRAGMVATALSAAVAVFVFLGPQRVFSTEGGNDWTALLLFLASGALISLTAGKRVEERRLRNQETFKNLIENNPMGIYVVDSDFKLRHVSRGARKAFASIESPIGKDVGDCLRTLWPEPFASEAIGQFRNTLNTGQPYVAVDTVERRRDIDAVEAYDWRLERVTLPDGRFGVVCYYYDLTEQRRLEQELRQNEEQFRAMFTITNVGKAQTDPATGRFLRVNAALCRMTGYTEAELLSRTIKDITHPEDRDRDWASFSRMARAEAAHYENEKRCVRGDGSIVWAHISASLIRDAQGMPLRTTAVIHDITERKRAEEALKRSRDRLELLSQTIGTLLTAPDPQLVIEGLCHDVRVFLECDVFFNFVLDDATKRLRLNACGGVDPRVARKVEGLELGASLCGSAAQGACRVLAESLQSGTDPRATLVKSLGIRAYACHPLLTGGGEVIGTLSFGASNRDAFSPDDLELMKIVTDYVAVAILRRRSEDALRKSELKYRQLHETLRDAFVITGMDGRIRDCNAVYQNMVGYTKAELLSLTYFDLTPEKWHALEAGLIEDEVLPNGSSRVYEKEYRRKDGTVFPVEMRTFLIQDESGQPQQMWAIVRDVTERKRAEERLREGEERLRLALEGARAAGWETDLASGSNLWGQGMAELLGLPRDEPAIVQSRWAEYIHPDDRERVLRSFSDAAQCSGSRWSEEFRVIRPDGSEAWLMSLGTCFEFEGKSRRMLGVTFDISSRKAAEQVLRRSKQELERLVRERTARLQELVNELEHFSYTITHDMRAPLRAMRGVAEIVNDPDAQWTDEDKQKLLRRIIVAAERMDGLITDALNYSKSVRQEVPLAPVELGELLRGMIETYPEFQETGAEIALDATLPTVMGNYAALTQCFSNLLGNAVKFARPGQKPVVHVRAEPLNGSRGSWVRIWVEDNGVGISPAMKPRVFNMFSRGSHARAGTGIGLALVRKVVDRMGGQVGLESEEGNGSRFWVELRLAE